MAKRQPTRRALPDAPPPPAGAPAPGRLARLRARWLAVDGAPLALDRTTTVVLLASAVLITLEQYLGGVAFYARSIGPRLGATLPGGFFPLDPLVQFWYSVLAVAVFRILLPAAVVRWGLRGRLADFGFRLPPAGHWAPYGLVYLAFLPVLLGVSFLPDFQGAYPRVPAAYASWSAALTFHLGYLIRFAAVEAFFRGFMLFPLYRRLGAAAIPIMTVPYCMIHFNKPMGEALGSIAAGMLLGTMALQSGSWIPGMLLHWGVGMTMDLLSLAQRAL